MTVELTYGHKFADDAEWVLYLFERYSELTAKICAGLLFLIAGLAAEYISYHVAHENTDKTGEVEYNSSYHSTIVSTFFPRQQGKNKQD